MCGAGRNTGDPERPSAAHSVIHTQSCRVCPDADAAVPPGSAAPAHFDDGPCDTMAHAPEC